VPKKKKLKRLDSCSARNSAIYCSTPKINSVLYGKASFYLKVFTKIILFIICILQISCSEKKENSGKSDKITISIWATNNDKEMEFMKKTAKMFEEQEPQIKIKLKFFTFNELKPKFIGQEKGAGEPDIIYTVNDWIGELAEKKLLKEIPGEYKQFIPSTIDSLKYKGQIYALPRNFEVIALVYNKSLVSEPPQTVKSLIEISQKLKKQGKYGFMYENTNFYFHIPWFYGFGGKIVDSDGKLVISSLKSPASFKFVQDLQNKYQILPGNSNESAMINLFCSNDVGMIVTGPWAIDEIERNKINYGISPLPVLDNGNRLKPFIGVKGFAISNQSHYPEKAKQVLDFFTGPDVQKMAMQELEVLPALNNFYNKEKLPERIQGFYEQAKYGTLMPTYPEMKYVWQEYNWVLNQIFNSSEPLEKILDKAAQDIKKQVGTEKL
jgi:arabinogalactan oligomer/maltooligosaccharide transport system substrate-binding protein